LNRLRLKAEGIRQAKAKLSVLFFAFSLLFFVLLFAFRLLLFA
jgi:hypothetical protein